MPGPRCTVVPDERPEFETAVRDAAGEVVDLDHAEAIIWTDPTGADSLRRLLDRHPEIRWVQLPYAGIEPFVPHLDTDRVWTSGKGVYAEPVAEHALMLALAGMRGGLRYARETRWSDAYGQNLLGARVTILGGGEIARCLIRLLRPFGVHLTVVRNRVEPIPGAADVLPTARLHDALRDADLVVLALALTPETRGILNAAAFQAMPDRAWVVNVARGGHIETDALVAALQAGTIAGAGLDVTDPEPLPEGHPLWHLPNVLITPHVGNTPEMGLPLLAARIRENVRRYADGRELLGLVDIELGY